RPQRVRQLAPVDHAGGRQQPAATWHRLDRPLPDPPPRVRHRPRRDAGRAHRPRPRRKGPLPGLLDVSGRDDRRGPVGGREQRAQLAEETGISLIHLALAFVTRHPAITAAIIGPRTMEQLESQVGAAEVQLEDAVLDRIDEIVPPGTNLNPLDAGWQNPAIEP